ncbi:hypothetical protein CYMTET_4675 [Cymbomonas tetramitiformis]|uniref:Uncharacterized protein n=1 Tax=Cymbomonas tetramitiformis TaxID=36881 RepID=A0AAE0H0X9_9CHLO|nr:hypothetical protein CYMTET_4675 [Cymbomonas tetramitiformis]
MASSASLVMASLASRAALSIISSGGLGGAPPLCAGLRESSNALLTSLLSPISPKRELIQSVVDGTGVGCAPVDAGGSASAAAANVPSRSRTGAVRDRYPLIPSDLLDVTLKVLTLLVTTVYTNWAAPQGAQQGEVAGTTAAATIPTGEDSEAKQLVKIVIDKIRVLEPTLPQEPEGWGAGAEGGGGSTWRSERLPPGHGERCGQAGGLRPAGAAGGAAVLQEYKCAKVGRGVSYTTR